MLVYLLEPYLTDSHKYWANNFIKHSSHAIQIFSLPGKHWKWRMHGAAITLAESIKSLPKPSSILVSEMCNVSTLKALLPKKWTDVRIVVYFHENQITFPWSASDSDIKKNRNNHYGFINYTSCLSSDAVIFNSNFHKEDFLGALPLFLKQFPDNLNLESISQIEKKSTVIPIGIDTNSRINQSKWKIGVPRILWNHRWENDKSPTEFFQTLFELKKDGLKFELVVLGRKSENYPEVFNQAEEILKSEIIHFGFCDSLKEYKTLVESCHLIPVTSYQDYFGISALEAVSNGVYPLLPNRLAFPEHFSGKSHIYESSIDLKERLKSFLNNWSQEKNELKAKTEGFIQEIESKYNWKKIAKTLDSELSN